MDNPEKLAKQAYKTKTQHNMCRTPPYANNVNKIRALIQFVCRNRNEHKYVKTQGKINN